MACEIVASEQQYQEHAEKLNSIANGAASKIIEARDKASREMLLINEKMRDILSKLKASEHQEAVLSRLSDKAAVMQERLEGLGEILGWSEDHADELLGLVGKVVCIKSSSSTHMTAAAVGEFGRIVCVWMGSDGYKEAIIPFSALKVVEQEGGAK